MSFAFLKRALDFVLRSAFGPTTLRGGDRRQAANITYFPACDGTRPTPSRRNARGPQRPLEDPAHPSSEDDVSRLVWSILADSAPKGDKP